MLYHWQNTICPVSAQDIQLTQSLTLTGEGLWVCLLSSGNGSAFVGGGSATGTVSLLPSQPIRPGMLILSCSPLVLQPETPCHFLLLQLTGSASAEFLTGLPHLPFLARGETCPNAAELLHQICEEFPSSKSSIGQYAFALLCELAHADSATPPLPPLVVQAIEDIRQNYAGLYGVEELSERLGVSKGHLVRTFTAAVGVTPGKYLTSVRIEAAMRLLLHREYTLEVIASLCGFSGANYLCRVFRRETGHSPAQWRTLAASGYSVGLSAEENRREQELFI